MLNIAAQVTCMSHPHSAWHHKSLREPGRPARPVAASTVAAIEHWVNNILDANVGLDGDIFRDAWRNPSAVMSTNLSCVSAQPTAVKTNDQAKKGTSNPGSAAFQSQIEVQHELFRRTRTVTATNKMATS